MERQRDDNLQAEWDSGRPGRRLYTSPELQEWGSILELTQGGNTLGKNDFPKKNGSQPA